MKSVVHRRLAMSLVEIMIVIVIIGILAAIAVPKFANASKSARESAIQRDLQLLRTQLSVYRTQHQDTWPGFPGGDTSQTPTAGISIDQLMKFTDAQGFTSVVGADPYKFGPYVLALPQNPLNGLSNWKILGPADPVAADDSSAWLYQPSSGIIKPNISGADSGGKSYMDY